MESTHRDLSPKPLSFFIKNQDGSRGPLIAESYTRLVVGGLGEYVEFDPSMIRLSEVEIEPGQEYRQSVPWIDTVYYLWERTKVAHRKLYIQRKTVKYADYLIGMTYISRDDLIYDGPLYAEPKIGWFE